MLASAAIASDKMDYVSGAAVQTALAEGKLRAMTSADGKKAMFNSDGTGRLSEPVKL
jgi:hypothetical protein